MSAGTSSALDLASTELPTQGRRTLKISDAHEQGGGDAGACRAAFDAPESDERLMERYRGGELGAFDLLYRRHRAPLRRLIARLARDSDGADEIFQEVWTAVVRGRRSYRPTARFSTYLFSIAHRRLQDRWRRSGRRAAVFDDSTPPPLSDEVAGDAASLPENWISNVQLRRALLAAIDGLPPAQREVFLLRVETDLSLEEIAAATGAPLEATKSRLRYAVARLRAQLGGWK